MPTVKIKTFDNMDEEKIISTVQKRLKHFHKNDLFHKYTNEAFEVYNDRDKLVSLSQEYWKKSTEEKIN